MIRSCYVTQTGLLASSNPRNSASWVSGTIDMGHHAWPHMVCIRKHTLWTFMYINTQKMILKDKTLITMVARNELNAYVPLKFLCWNLNPEYNSTGRYGLPSGHEGGTLMNGTREIPGSVHEVRLHEQTLTRYQIYQCLHLGLPSLLNGEK